jgi:hypothetical protein
VLGRQESSTATCAGCVAIRLITELEQLTAGSQVAFHQPNSRADRTGLGQLRFPPHFSQGLVPLHTESLSLSAPALIAVKACTVTEQQSYRSYPPTVRPCDSSSSSLKLQSSLPPAIEVVCCNRCLARLARSLPEGRCSWYAAASFSYRIVLRLGREQCRRLPPEEPRWLSLSQALHGGEFSSQPVLAPALPTSC